MAVTAAARGRAHGRAARAAGSHHGNAMRTIGRLYGPPTLRRFATRPQRAHQYEVAALGATVSTRSLLTQP